MNAQEFYEFRTNVEGTAVSYENQDDGTTIVICSDGAQILVEADGSSRVIEQPR